MGEERPPHPGPAPDPVVFPFAEARVARDAARALADELRRLRSAHRDARDHVEAGVFEGNTANRFREGFDELMDRIDGHIIAVEGQADTIEADIARAEAEQAAYESALFNWRAAERAWATWTAPAPAN